ncbi:Protein of unknown function [Nakamurella panacisegetis]|uniref:dATP/dGTP diphosphohydrolase MazZ domain-containing protein n=1 Tax=Nakamurella panacisegetis TaxID=1090615 RepID=A0A1H0Q0B4_9ACTN|nr:dATP/dGTP pyrophosphohydrolase domain-containing protein [Nakamurella panacisegetis]SDP10128.1 Protein of unknown function [Nakamurella panacisegetis]
MTDYADTTAGRREHARRSAVDLAAHLERQAAWSRETFGPAPRTTGILAHIGSEIAEIAAAPEDLSEWMDVVILAFDGALRVATPAAVVAALVAKQDKNEGRTWPDWRQFGDDEAIEHDRTGE